MYETLIILRSLNGFLEVHGRNFQARGTHNCTHTLSYTKPRLKPTAWPVPQACAFDHISRVVAAMDSCFTLIGAHQHGIWSTRRVSPFLAWGDFHARSRFARSIIPEEKWGTTRSLINEGHQY